MKRDIDLSLEKTLDEMGIAPVDTFLVLAPTNAEAMSKFIHEAQAQRVHYLFSPAQQTPYLSREDLLSGVTTSIIPISKILTSGAWFFNTWNLPFTPGIVTEVISPLNTALSGVIISKFNDAINVYYRSCKFSRIKCIRSISHSPKEYFGQPLRLFISSSELFQQLLQLCLRKGKRLPEDHHAFRQ